MPNQSEVTAAKLAAQKALFDRIASAANPNAQLSFPNLEHLARSFRYAAGGTMPMPAEADDK